MSTDRTTHWRSGRLAGSPLREQWSAPQVARDEDVTDYLSARPTTKARIDAGLSMAQQRQQINQGKGGITATHAAASALRSANKARHDAEIDLALMMRVLP